MSKVSIIIPSRNEKYLSKTVDDIFAKAAEEIEIIVVLDGPTDYLLPKKRKNLIFIKRRKAKGLRHAINDGSDVATGKYLLKIDAHSMVSEGFDVVLKRTCEDNWVVSSRYHELDAEKWKVKKDVFYDYFYFSCPWNTSGFLFRDVTWISRDAKRESVTVDDTLAMQGSFYFMAKKHFQKRIGYLDTKRWGGGIMDQQEIVLKTWLSGGRVMVNKEVWNAHYHRPMKERLKLIPEFTRNDNTLIHKKFTEYILRNEWEGCTSDFASLIERFWPLPSPRNRRVREIHSWPTNWKDYYVKYLNK